MELLNKILGDNNVIISSVASILILIASIKLTAINEYLKILLEIIKIVKGARKSQLDDIVFDIRQNTEIEGVIQQYKYDLDNDKITRVRIILATAGKYDLKLGMCEYVQQVSEYSNTQSTIDYWNYQVPSFGDIFYIGNKLHNSDIAIIDISEIKSPLILGMMHKYKEKQLLATWLGGFGDQYGLFAITVFKEEVTQDDLSLTRKFLYTIQNELLNISGFKKRII